VTVDELRTALSDAKALGLGSIAVKVPRKNPLSGRRLPRYVRIVPGVNGELIGEYDGGVIAYARIADLERYLRRVESGEL